jgi:glycine betaine/proline transport system permease protein
MSTTTAAPAIKEAWRPEQQFVNWCIALAISIAIIMATSTFPWLLDYPKDWVVPLAKGIDAAADAILPFFKPSFRFISWCFERPMWAMQALLQAIGWPLFMAMVLALAMYASGWRLAVFALLTMVYLLVAGYWRQSMNTLALVLIAVPISVGLGFLIGVLGYRFPKARAAINTLLDLMQTVPAFAYLIPLLLLFGFGPVVGLISSAIYSAPPMVRNTMLGLQMVPQTVREAAIMSGATRRQGFWQAEVPTAVPQLLIGLNQTTNAAFSMVIVAAIIGGFDDIGWEVLSAMRKAEFGQSLLSGLVIALLAILIDRITLGIALSSRRDQSTTEKFITGKRLAWTVVVCLSAALALYALRGGEPLWTPGPEMRVGLASLNDLLLGVVRDHAATLETIKNSVLYFVMLPLRIGVAGSATPAVWGVTMTPPLEALYLAIVLGVAALLTGRFSWRAGMAAIFAGILLYFGFLGTPWPVFILAVGLLAYDLGGPRIALLAVASLGFILVVGLWPYLMASSYLCALAVALCLLIGGALGLWAERSDRVSKILRPINDALQTMPQFVFLIPALMFFKVGDFTALIAVMLYAIVPPIRYVEHGLRTVRADIVEAARQMGCVPRQALWQVKFPMALPVIMLGLNQTIMAGLSMLTIAALVGTRDLGQQVYVALGKADTGLGLIAGLSIALVATTSDRMIQSWAKRHSTGT